MLMFHADIAFALELIALAFGVFLLIWMRMHAEQSCKGSRFLAHFIVVLAILALLCTSYFTVKYWIGGYFSSPNPMMMQRGKMQSMMRGCMMKRGRQNMPMQNMMKNCMGQKKIMPGKKMGAMPVIMKKQMLKGKKIPVSSSQIIPTGDSNRAAHH